MRVDATPNSHVTNKQYQGTLQHLKPRDFTIDKLNPSTNHGDPDDHVPASPELTTFNKQKPAIAVAKT
jgi:hypothetical protein